MRTKVFYYFLLAIGFSYFLDLELIFTNYLYFVSTIFYRNRIKIMSRTKGSKNKQKYIKRKSKKRCDIMANVNDVLNAVTNLNSAVDTLIVNIGNLKTADTQPAIDAINAVTSKIQSIQLPANP